MSSKPPIVGDVPPPLFSDEVVSVGAKNGVVLLSFAAPSLTELTADAAPTPMAPIARTIVSRVALTNEAAWLLLSRLGTVLDAEAKRSED